MNCKLHYTMTYWIAPCIAIWILVHICFHRICIYFCESRLNILYKNLDTEILNPMQKLCVYQRQINICEQVRWCWFPGLFKSKLTAIIAADYKLRWWSAHVWLFVFYYVCVDVIFSWRMWSSGGRRLCSTWFLGSSSWSNRNPRSSANTVWTDGFVMLRWAAQPIT